MRFWGASNKARPVAETMITAQSNFGLDLSSSATAQILRGALPGGESKRTFFTVFTLRFRKHTNDHDWIRVNERLGIHHEMYPKGRPWQNLIESYFGIEARLGEYRWERCKTIEAAQEFHRELIRDYNRLPHWAHRRRNDGKHSPLAVLGDARGKQVESADLERAFAQRYCQRLTDTRGFVRIGRWRIYIEDGLPRTPVQLSFWNGKLRAEYQSQILTEYQCKWGASTRYTREIETRIRSPNAQ